LQNYFIPTLNPALAALAPLTTTTTTQPPRAPLVPVGPLLRRYKALLKTVSRDASLRTRHAADISGVLREIERWLAEARVEAHATHANANELASWLPCQHHHQRHRHRGRGRHAGLDSVVVRMDDGDDEDNGDGDEVAEPTEAWALDRFCEALLVKGALVPVSRK
jgi:ribosomal biogenesis protein LAS1